MSKRRDRGSKKGSKTSSKKSEVVEKDIDFKSPFFTDNLYKILKQVDFFRQGSESILDTVYQYIQYVDGNTKDLSVVKLMKGTFIDSIVNWLSFFQPTVNMYKTLIQEEKKNPEFRQNPENDVFYNIFYNLGFNASLKQNIPDTILSIEDVKKLIYHLSEPFFTLSINNIALSYAFSPTLITISPQGNRVELFGIYSEKWKDVVFKAYYRFKQEEFKKYSNSDKLKFIRDLTVEMEKIPKRHISMDDLLENKRILSIYEMEASPDSIPPSDNEIIDNSRINALLENPNLLKQETNVEVYHRFLNLDREKEIDMTKTHRALFNEIVMFVYIVIFDVKKNAHIQYNNKGNFIEILLSNGTLLDVNEDIDTDKRDYTELIKEKAFSQIFHIEEAFYICDPKDIENGIFPPDAVEEINEINILLKKCFTILRIFIYLAFMHVYGDEKRRIKSYPKNEVFLSRIVFASFVCKNIKKIHNLYVLAYELSIKLKEIKEKKEEERLKILEQISYEEFIAETLSKRQEKQRENRKKRNFIQGDFGDEEDEKDYPAPSSYSSAEPTPPGSPIAAGSPIATGSSNQTPTELSPVMQGEVLVRSPNSPSELLNWRKFRTVIPSSYMRYNNVSNSCSPVRREDNDYDSKKAYQCITKYKSYKEEKDPSAELEKRKSFFRLGCVPKQCIDRGHVSRMRRLSNDLDNEVEDMANNLAELNNELGEIRTVNNILDMNRALNDISANLDLINANIDSVNIQRTNRIISSYKNFLNLTDDERFQDRIVRLKDRIDFIETRLRD